ncbi:hypothetical protein BC941DRAFT_468896 [Chlamydoabsidia padenii]|nr:hypothetical protein BC941DRAFT_468896 [Chlamydoabsidia padenii]
MDLATILNPTSSKQQVQPVYLEPKTYHHHHHNGIHQYYHPAMHSPPLSPKRIHHGTPNITNPFSPTMISNMKPRSRFSALEDAIICQGVANGLTWGQISGQLPHRKRATCFNRYRTLQGIRKSRPHSMLSPSSYYHHQTYPYDYHHHHHHHHQSYQPTSHLSPLPSPPRMMMDNMEANTSSQHQKEQRRPSVCSSLSPSPLASPSSLPQHDQWNQDPYSRWPSNASTSPSSYYHYFPY